jgi:hypothetical protein
MHQARRKFMSRKSWRAMRLRAALASAVMLLTVWAFAADASGRWAGKFKDADSGKEAPVFAVLKQDGSRLTGTAGPSEPHQMAITSGKVEGDHLAFEVVLGGGATMSFDLTRSGPGLEGSMKLVEDGHTANATVVLKPVP